MNRPFHDVPSFLGASVPPAERRVALVIGNGRYALEKDALTNPPNDARGVAEALTRVGFFGVKQVGDEFAVDYTTPGVTPLLDLDQKGLSKALAALSRAADGVRQAVIYYAGHGIEVDGENYLIPVDARLAHIKDAEFETQPLTRALRTIEGATGLRLVILDACRNNPFRARLFGNRDASGGLRGIEPPSNVLVAYAAKHGTFASDGSKGKNSPFAAALLAHIEKPGLEVVELFREVKDDVRDATEGAQEPYLYGSLGRRREYFVQPTPVEVLALKPEPTTTAPIDDRTLEHTYWQDVKASTDAAELQAFLAQFPDGVFAGLAHERCKAAIDATSNPNALRRLLQRYPDGPRSSRMKRRLAQLEWDRLRKSRDIDGLNALAREFAGLPEADLARQRAASLSGSGGSTTKWRLIVFAGAAAALIAVLAVMRPWESVSLPTPTAATLPANIAQVEPQLKSAPLPAPKPPVRCAGIEINVIGTGKRCLDPADKHSREFEECYTTGGNRVCGPKMVVLPKGDYLQGDETQAVDGINRRKVSIDYYFAVGKFEVTFDEWAACVAGGGCQSNKSPSDQGSGKDTRPVINVSWNDAQEYVTWLNGKLGLPADRGYHLLSEAEWEFAARGVDSASKPHTAYSWGNDVTPGGVGMANCASCGSQWDYKQTAPVGSFPKAENAFGLNDMHGNVWEWVQDCYADTYKEAPSTGAAFAPTTCTSRVLRGGSWVNNPWNVSSAYRYGYPPVIRGGLNGFRLARTLNP